MSTAPPRANRSRLRARRRKALFLNETVQPRYLVAHWLLLPTGGPHVQLKITGEPSTRRNS